MSLRILVTGANGRTGRAIVDALQARGARVRGLVRKADQVGRLEGLGPRPCWAIWRTRPA